MKQNLVIIALTTVVLAELLLIGALQVGNQPKTKGSPVKLTQATQTPAAVSDKVTILLIGDIMLGRTVMTESLDKGDPTYPFRETANVLREADLVFANLENPIVEGCPRHYSGFKFCTDPSLTEGLTYAGVDVVTLANNHTNNYGNEGFEETKKFLEKSGVAYVGDNNLAVKPGNDKTFGFLGFDFLTNTPTQADYDLVRESSAKVDILIVGVHWGVEYVAVANNYQREIAQKLVESGADVIAGHHPHWVQDNQMIGNAPVYYSLGNFIFDQMWSEETKKGLAVRLIYEDGKLINQEMLPIYIPVRGQPKFVSE